ncbi:MAG: hypothetical protein IT209_00615 [Armatimonadetes bacterium]|nr:hypothetical protein [Armatimonadota bacterium]
MRMPSTSRLLTPVVYDQALTPRVFHLTKDRSTALCDASGTLTYTLLSERRNICRECEKMEAKDGAPEARD